MPGPFAALAFLLATLLPAASAGAMHIHPFPKATNDGIWTLPPHQIVAPSAPTPDRIGNLRLRGGGWLTPAPGDTFDARTIFAATRDDRRILGRRNRFGSADRIAVVGVPDDPLGLTRMVTGKDVQHSLALGFGAADAPIAFSGLGTATFTGDQTRGPFAILADLPLPERDALTADRGPPAAPLPAAGLLLLAAAGALGAVRLRAALRSR